MAVPDATYARYDRKKDGFNGTIDLQRQPPKPLTWACLPGTPLPAKYGDLSQGNLWDCFQNIDKNIQTFSEQFIDNLPADQQE